MPYSIFLSHTCTANDVDDKTFFNRSAVKYFSRCLQVRFSVCFHRVFNTVYAITYSVFLQMFTTSTF